MKQKTIFVKQRGSFIIESVWLWPILLMLTLGVVQMGFLYNAKATLNNATFQAARQGSINHADRGVMERRLAEAMAPLYTREANASELFAKRAVLWAAMKIPAAPIGEVDIISPTMAMYRGFEKTQYYLDEEGREKQLSQMPNDNLKVRSASEKSFEVSSASVRINLQDANLLKIRGHWCHEMIVPFVNYVIYQTYAGLPGAKNPHWGACRALSVIDDSYYLPVSATSVVRMQTPIRWE